MNYLDKVISIFSPSAGLRRLQARSAIDLMERAYDGASRGKKFGGWNAKGTSANMEISGGLVTLRNRSSDLVRNVDYVSNAKELWVSYVIGKGVRAKADKAALDLFKEWSLVCDADGLNDFIGLQALCTGAVWERGEVLVRLRPRRIKDGLPVPLQLQVLEGDHLDHTKTEKTAKGQIIQGVEFDAIGNRVAYWIFPTHPGDGFSILTGRSRSVRIPAPEILHIFEQERPGQVRGVPALAPVISRVRDAADYEEYERIRKKVEACFAGFITTTDTGGHPFKVDKDEGGKRKTVLEPGKLVELRPGESVAFAEPTSRGGIEHLAYVRNQLQGFSAGVKMPYGAVTNDLSQTNYSSMRAGELPTRRRVSRFTKRVVVQQMCRPVWSAFTFYGQLSGALASVEAAQWLPDRFDAVDPLKDIMSEILAIRSGLKNMDDAIAERGGSLEEWIATIKAFNDAVDREAIILDTDPRHLTKSGAFQAGVELAKEN